MRVILKLPLSFLIDYEVSNALMVAFRRNRLKSQVLHEIFNHYSKINLYKVDFSAFSYLALSIAQATQRTMYDSSYIALSEMRNIPFLTGDLKLYNAVHEVFPLICLVQDYL